MDERYRQGERAPASEERRIVDAVMAARRQASLRSIRDMTEEDIPGTPAWEARLDRRRPVTRPVIGESHPALCPTGYDHGADHFVPEEWETLDVGLCPCGEAVIWDEDANRWVQERSLRVLVLTPDDVHSLTHGVGWNDERLAHRMVVVQLLIQDEIIESRTSE